MKRAGVVALVLVVGVLALDALGVIPLGLFGGADPGGGDRDGDLLGSDGEAGDATLVGRGQEGGPQKKKAVAVPDSAVTVPATVKGGTPGGGVVRGRVVQEKGGVPVGGVKLTLTRPDSLIAYLRAPANGRFDTLEARTGSDGRFTFTDVTPSQGYALRAFHPGYAAASHPDRLDLRGRGTHDVGDLKLGPGATLTGRVVDEQENPLEGVRVAVTWRIMNPINVVIVHPDTAPEIEREALTDKEGRYRIDKLEPVPKTVFAEAPSGAAEIKTSVNLKPGQERELKDIVIPGARFLAGTVVWKSGGGVQGARIFGAPWQHPAMRSTETDAAGRWRLDWLPEGENYTLGVLLAGLPLQYVQGFALDTDDIVVEFAPPGALQGVVVQAGTGQPVTRFGIQLDDTVPSKDYMRRFVEQQVKLGLGPAPFQGPKGAFHFPRVAAGTYHVNVHAPGFPTVRHENVLVVAGETAEIRIEIPEGNVARGRVERSTGEPVSEARLYVLPAGSVKEGALSVNLGGITRDRDPVAASRADGSFVLPPQTPGRVDVIAEVEDELPGVLRNVDLGDGDVGGLVIRMPPSGRVKGLILDESARPAAGEQVYVLYPTGIVRIFVAGEDGRFDAGGLPIGPCLVRWVSLGDARTYFRFIRGKNPEEKERAYDELRLEGEEHVISDGNVTQVTIRLPLRTKISGRFRIAGNPPSEPRREFYVTVEGGGHWKTIVADEHGEYELRLPHGKYIAYVPTSSDHFEAIDFEIPDVPTHALDFDVE